MHSRASVQRGSDRTPQRINKETPDMTQEAQSRRRFLKGAAGAGAATAALAAPMIARAQTPITLRFQSTWPAKDIFHEYAQDYAKLVNDMSGGRLRIEVLPAGSVVRAFDMLDAVSKGTLDGGHGVLAYWYGKNSAIALWGSGPAFGMDPNMVLAWHQYGGGEQLLAEVHQAMNVNVRSLVYGPMPTQPLGWFKKPVTSVNDFKGLKYRTVGLSIDIFTELGAAVNALPGAEIVPALDRGLLDAAEFNNASSDRLLGFPDVSKICMLQSFHQASEQFEIVFNKQKYDALPADLKKILDAAASAASAEMSWKAIDRYSKDYDALRAAKIQFFKTPDPVLRAQLAAWDKILEKKSAENPLFKKVADSMRTFAQRAGRWQNDTLVNYRMAYDHYFNRRG
jgi:TRAP-type mannitol/chloroaromatic compound transport system substrate-binding protein